MKRAMVAVLVLAMGVVGWRAMKGEKDGERVLTKHVWIDSFPEQPRQMIQIFAAVKDRGQTAGIFANTSAFKLTQELFVWKTKSASAIAVEYPQTGEREEVTYRITDCKEDEFTLCMEVRGNSRGVRKYRSNEDLVIEDDAGVEAVQAKVRQLEARAK